MVRGKTTLNIQWFEFLDAAENKRADAPVVHELDASRGVYEFSDGTDTSTKCDQIWSDRRSINGASTSTIDLGTGGGLLDSFGNSITKFAEVVEIAIYNRNTTAGQLVQFGPHTTNGFLDPFDGTAPLVEIHPGGCLLLRNPQGWATVDGSADTLRLVVPGGTAIEVDIFLCGRSA